jgi:hypothetical protein
LIIRFASDSETAKAAVRALKNFGNSEPLEPIRPTGAPVFLALLFDRSLTTRRVPVEIREVTLHNVVAIALLSLLRVKSAARCKFFLHLTTRSLAWLYSCPIDNTTGTGKRAGDDLWAIRRETMDVII